MKMIRTGELLWPRTWRVSGSSFRLLALLAAGLMAGMPALAQAPGATQESQGSLLYSTHCTACHTAQAHWRDNKLAKGWPGLKTQVQRWQVNGGQRWSADEITAVARYLNALYYHYDTREE